MNEPTTTAAAAATARRSMPPSTPTFCFKKKKKENTREKSKKEDEDEEALTKSVSLLEWRKGKGRIAIGFSFLEDSLWWWWWWWSAFKSMSSSTSYTSSLPLQWPNGKQRRRRERRKFVFSPTDRWSVQCRRPRQQQQFVFIKLFPFFFVNTNCITLSSYTVQSLNEKENIAAVSVRSFGNERTSERTNERSACCCCLNDWLDADASERGAK